MVVFVFGRDENSWGLSNTDFWGRNNLTYNALEQDFDKGLITESKCRWASIGPGQLCAFFSKQDNSVWRPGDNAELVADMLHVNGEQVTGDVFIKHVTFSAEGGWFIAFHDGTVRLSKNNSFPESFHQLIRAHGQCIQTRGPSANERQRCNISNVWFGAREAVLVQFADGTIDSENLPAPLLDQILQRHLQGYRLTPNTTLCHYSSDYYFAEWAKDDGSTKVHAWKISPTGTLTDLFVQETVEGRLPISPLRKNGSEPVVMYPAGKTENRELSKSLFKSVSGDKGFLTGEETINLLKTSGVRDEDVLKIWELADEDGNGQFDEDELVFAMELVRRYLGSYALPNKALATIPTSSSAPAYREIDGPIKCNRCKRTITGECKHCSRCDDGNFDLCRSCAESGSQCPQNHEMYWLVVVDTSEALTANGSRSCDLCGSDIFGVTFSCKECSDGDWDACEACIGAMKTCPEKHTLIKKTLPNNNVTSSTNGQGNAPADASDPAVHISSLNLGSGKPAADSSTNAAPAEPPATDMTSAITADFNQLKESLKGSIVSEKPNVHWDDVAGLDTAKDELQEAIVLPIKFPQLFSGQRKARRGMLMYGPPGTGKSYLAKAVATEVDSTLFSVSSADVMSKWYGDSERLIQALFTLAREHKPSVIFIDEIDALCSNRDGPSNNEDTARMKTELLVQMDGVGKDNTGVLVLAATNLPWTLDPALRRRLQKRIYIPLPNAAARARMFELAVADIPSDLTPDDLTAFGAASEGFSGSDIANAVQDALMQPVKKVLTSTHWKKITVDGAEKFTPCPPDDEGATPMTWRNVSTSQLQEPHVVQKDFYDVLKKTKASVGTDELAKYSEWTEKFGLEGA